MNARVIAAALLLVAGSSTSDSLLACGEKFLMGSRGTRFHRPTVRQSAAILVYANPALNLAKALANVPFEATLRKAGYRPTVVTTAEAFSKALSQGGWDLVLADVSDSQALTGRTRNGNSPIVLPVLYNPTGAELASAKKQHARILKAPTKNQAFLDAIDDALAQRSAGHATAGG